jgi:hypothetical protein
LSALFVANVITTFPPSQPSSPFPLFPTNLTRLDHYTEIKNNYISKVGVKKNNK